MTSEKKRHLPQPKSKKAECSNCGGERNCWIRTRFLQQGGDNDFSWQVTWLTLECQGCEHVFVQTISTNSEAYENYYEPDGSSNYHVIETLSYWPAISKRNRPEWMSEAGIDAENVEDLDKSLLELYGALDNDLHMLAAIGIRTSFDIASRLLDIDPELSFIKKLETLVTTARISTLDFSRINVLVIAGSASAHRGWIPTAEELKSMMEILEHFIFITFVEPARRTRLDARALELQARIPHRKAAKAKPIARNVARIIQK